MAFIVVVCSEAIDYAEAYLRRWRPNDGAGARQRDVLTALAEGWDERADDTQNPDVAKTLGAR